MNKLKTMLSAIVAGVVLPGCAAMGELLPGGVAQAEAIGTVALANAPVISDQAGMLTTMFTGNPALGGAVATALTGIAGIFAAKKIKAKKAAGAPTA